MHTLNTNSKFFYILLFCQQILRISLIEHVSNAEVLIKKVTTRKLILRINKRHLPISGTHMERGPEESNIHGTDRKQKEKWDGKQQVINLKEGTAEQGQGWGGRKGSNIT